MPSVVLRDEDAELINFHQDCLEVSNLYGFACRAVVLAEDEDFYRLASSLWQASHFRIESLWDKNTDQVDIVPGRLQKAPLIRIPSSFCCRKILQNRIIVNEHDINFSDQYSVVIKPRLYEQRLNFPLRCPCERCKQEG